MERLCLRSAIEALSVSWTCVLGGCQYERRNSSSPSFSRGGWFLVDIRF